MKTLHDTWQQVNLRFEALLKELYLDHGEPQALLFEAMNYSLLAGGKRLRPFLTYSFCQAVGADVARADSAALAIEMIHTYSLIHDDLPCMDNDDYRRGKLTNHKVYGEGIAALAGDGLLTDAFRVLTSGSLDAAKACACVRVLSQNAGPWGMVGGQVLDILSESRTCTRQEVLDVQSRKTGGLIRAACQMGVICAGGSDEMLRAAGTYADHLGLAFQIRDDILDQTGDAALLGKAVGVDEGKNTFVRLYGLEACEAMVLEQTELAIDALAAFRTQEVLTELARNMAVRNH